MEHFAFPGTIDFAADDQRIFMYYSCVYSSMKQCLQSVNHEQSSIQMTQNNKHNKWLQILDFQPKLLWRTPTKIHRERRGRRQQKAACKAQRTSLSTTKKRLEDQATLTGYSKITFFDATIGSNGYTICTMHVKNILPTDWGQPISLYTRGGGDCHIWAI